MRNKLFALMIVIISLPVFNLYAGPEDGIRAYPVPYNPRKGNLKIDDQNTFGAMSFIKMIVYDVNGDVCASRSYADFPFEWNGRNGNGSTISPGLYIIKVEANEASGYYGKKLLRILVRY